MIVLGILLVVIGVLAAAVAVLAGNTPVLVSWHQYEAHTRLVAVYLAGAATLFVVEAGLMLMRGGSSRRVSRWRELQRLRRLEREQTRDVPDEAVSPRG